MTIKTAEIIALAAVGIIAYGFINKAVALGALNFYPDRVVSIQFDNSTPVMTISLRCQNTSSQSFTIQSLSGNIFANNVLVGNVSEFGSQIIAANSEAFVTVNVRMAIISIVNDIIRALQFGNFGQSIVLQGSVNVDNYQIPLNMNFQVGSKAPAVTGAVITRGNEAGNNLKVAI